MSETGDAIAVGGAAPQMPEVEEGAAKALEDTAVKETLEAPEQAQAAQGEASGEGAEPTEEELAAEAERLAAEKAAREARERAERKAADEEAAQIASAAAVQKIGAGAGFITSAGVYYDVDAPSRVAFQYADSTQGQSATEQVEGEDGANGGDEGSLDVDTQSNDAILDGGATDEGTFVDEQTFARQVARITDSVVRQSLHREIFYKTLAYCEEMRPLRDIEEKIATFSEFKRAAASQYHFIKVMEEAGGLERFELDEEGEIVLPEQKVGLTEDEIDDLVFDYAFMTTAPGLAVVEQHTPKARIIELLGLVPERHDAYIELMDFVSDEPRTYNEITQLFAGRDVLWRIGPDGDPQKMQPSVFVDKLEAAGGIEYRDGWVLTEEGKGFLEELRAAAEQ